MSPFCNCASSAATIFSLSSRPFRFRLVAAEDVALALDLDLFDEELRLASLALDEQRNERRVVFEHELAHDGVGAFARAKDVFEPAGLQPLDRRRRDRAAGRDDADATNGETSVQPVDDPCRSAGRRRRWSAVSGGLILPTYGI